jgi:hypothetical protein
LVQTLAKGDKPIDVIVSFWNFCHVLQILPKHLKIYQNKSCAESPGTQIIFRVALLILSEKGAKLPSKLMINVHRDMTNPEIGIQFSLSI